MIWLTWRQQRLEALIGGGILALLAIFLLITGRAMASTYQSLGVGACLTAQTAACGEIIDAFRNQYAVVGGIIDWLVLLPLLLAILLAAPFVLELEQGTYRLVWTQSITRTRWAVWKLGLLVSVAVLVSVALTALLTWWRTPFDQLDGSFQPHTFDVEGTAPVAYTLFAVALVLAVGTLLRRTVPAVAISLVGFLALRLGLETWARPVYMPPLVTSATQKRADWVLGQFLRDRQGHQANVLDILRACGKAVGAREEHLSESCMTQHGFSIVTTYQPGDRFWAFQGIETAIFLGIAGGLLALTVWWIRARVV